MVGGERGNKISWKTDDECGRTC